MDEIDSTGTGEYGLSVKYTKAPKRPGPLAFKLAAEVVSASGIPADVFVFHRQTRTLATGYPFDGRAGAVFQNVATPVDIEETPAEADAKDSDRFFRSAKVELLFRNSDDLELAKARIDADVAELVRSWRELDGGEGEEETREYS